MKILALIPARGGSKRLPGKNIRPLGGKPLIVWSIEIAKSVETVCDVLVSTDDAKIAEVARQAEALVPWLRPADLASDTAGSVDVCLHALDWYEQVYGAVDGLMLLQPTSPFRSRESVLRGVQLFAENERRPVVGVSYAASHPQWCFRLDGLALRPFVPGGGLNLRSQDLPPAVVLNGGFYLVQPQDLRRRRQLFSDDMLPLLCDDPMEAVDIDTAADWRIAEALFAEGRETL